MCPSGSLGVGVKLSLSPAFAVGSSSSASRGAHPVNSSGSVRGFGWCSWLSTLPASWFRFLQLSQFPVVLAWGCRCLHFGPYARPLFGSVAVPPHLASCLIDFTSPRLSSSLFPRHWLILGSAFQVVVEAGPSSACVVSSASSSCLQGALRCRLLLSTRGLPLVSFSWSVFSPSCRCCCSLLFFRPSCPSVSILCRSEAVFWESCPLWQPWSSVLWSPCGISRFASLGLVMSGRRGSCVLVRCVLSDLRWWSAISLLFVGLLLGVVHPVLFLFSVSSVLAWRRCSRRPPPFRLVVSSRLALLIYHRVLLAFLSAVHGFLPSLRGRSVAFSSGSMALASLRGPGELFPGLSLFCAFGLPLRLPSFLSCSSGVFAAWWLSSPLGKRLPNEWLGFLLRHSFLWGCVLCCLSPVSLTPLLSWFCFSFSILGWSAVCLSFSCVSSGPSRWGHPSQGRVFVVCPSTQLERRLSLSVSFVFLRDGVTLWVKCVLHTLLIAIEGLPLAVGSCSFRLGSPAGYCCLRLFFRWLCIIVCLCATCLFPVRLLSALWASFSWHPFLALLCCALGHWFFFLPYFVIFAWCVLSLSLSLSLPFMSLLEVFGWSSGPFVALCCLFGFCFLVGSRPGGPFLVSRASAPRVSGFQDVSLMFSFRAPLLPFLPSRGLLHCRGTLYALCLAPFLSGLWRLFCVVCRPCSFFLLSLFHGLSRSSCLFVEGVRVWLLMPSGLLAWQIPYREMRSLGLKVSVRRGSRLPCLCCVVYGGL